MFLFAVPILVLLVTPDQTCFPLRVRKRLHRAEPVHPLRPQSIIPLSLLPTCCGRYCNCIVFEAVFMQSPNSGFLTARDLVWLVRREGVSSFSLSDFDSRWEILNCIEKMTVVPLVDVSSARSVSMRITPARSPLLFVLPLLIVVVVVVVFLSSHRKVSSANSLRQRLQENRLPAR